MAKQKLLKILLVSAHGTFWRWGYQWGGEARRVGVCKAVPKSGRESHPDVDLLISQDEYLLEKNKLGPKYPLHLRELTEVTSRADASQALAREVDRLRRTRDDLSAEVASLKKEREAIQQTIASQKSDLQRLQEATSTAEKRALDAEKAAGVE